MPQNDEWHGNRQADPMVAVSPLESPPSGSVPTPPSNDALVVLLRQRFGIPEFHPFQREAIDALLCDGGRVLLVAPTGGGKSLTYQLPAVALSGTALVLSPLISLMEDQVRALHVRGIPATFVASTLPREENGRRLAGLREGRYKIVYAAPERLAFDGFLDALAASQLSLVAVDEAHCIVQWGHDFRPDYLRIGAAIERLRPPRVIACTATATPDARAEIMRRLGWDSDSAHVVLRGFARPNLHLSVATVEGPRGARLETERALRAALGSPRAPGGAAIVYAATRKTTEALAAYLREQAFEAQAYHAGMDPEARARVSSRFAARSLPVVVATNAFGMGIDRPDVRVVVHAQPPSSIEAYYQEVGRAGRDGANAAGLLLIAPSDIALRRRLAALGEGGAAAPPDQAARVWGLFRELLQYVDAGSCRHDFILRYFGDEAESLGGCGHCDVCRDVDARVAIDPTAAARDLDVVRRALSGVARAKASAGMAAIAAMLAGENSARVTKLGLDQLSTFGVLPGRTADEALVILRVLLAAGLIDLTPGDFPVPLVTPVGWRVMRGEVSPRICLPRGRPRVPSASRRSLSGAVLPKKPPRDRSDHLAPGREGLFERLRAVRSALAKAKAVPAYVIAPDRTLEDLATLRPQTVEDLALVHGMGPARILAYGEALLRVVQEAPSGK